jgi:hypothetical protein
VATSRAARDQGADGPHHRIGHFTAGSRPPTGFRPTGSVSSPGAGPGADRARDLRRGSGAVSDVLFVLLTVVVFAALTLALRGVEKL